MKRILLVGLLGIAVPATLNAQTLEWGVGGGFSTNTSPSGNMKYQTDQSVINYACNLRLLYTGGTGFQIGLDANMVGLSGKSSKKYPHFKYADSVGGDGKTLVYAKYAPALCVVANKVLNINKNNIYIGLALGYGAARNNSEILKNNESYRGPDGGHGIVLGGQIGYVGYLSEKLGLNIEVAVRSYSFKFDAAAPLVTPREDLHYGVVAIPITVGLRYYVFRTLNNAVPRPYRIRPKGRSLY